MIMDLRFLLIGASIGMATACVSVLPEQAAPDALYRIEASTRAPGLSQSLIVREPEAPRLFGGQRMVSEASDGGLRIVPGVEWSGPATRQLQLAMIDSFKIEENASAVLPELGIVSKYELATQITSLKLEQETGICEMVVSIIDTGDRTLVARKQLNASEQSVSSAPGDRALALESAASNCALQASEFAIETLSRDEL